MFTIPVNNLKALIVGCANCGIPEQKIVSELKLDISGKSGSDLIPYEMWERAWEIAQAIDGRPDLPTLVARAIPFGTYGIVDYLVGSAETLEDGLRTLANFFAGVSHDRLEITADNRDLASVRLHRTSKRIITDEFAISLIIDRFQQVTNGKFNPIKVFLTRPPVETPHIISLSSKLEYAASSAGFDMPSAMLTLPLTSADPGLNQTLFQLAVKMGLDKHADSLVDLIHAQLRKLLPQGLSSAYSVAHALGLSERTFQRRLTESKISFQSLSDQFRLKESERYIKDGDHSLAQIALMVGYADQASWTRAFKRVRGISPKAWRSANRVSIEDHLLRRTPASAGFSSQKSKMSSEKNRLRNESRSQLTSNSQSNRLPVEN